MYRKEWSKCIHIYIAICIKSYVQENEAGLVVVLAGGMSTQIQTNSQIDIIDGEKQNKAFSYVQYDLNY